jgi:hypothetical protein
MVPTAGMEAASPEAAARRRRERLNIVIMLGGIRTGL